MRKNPAKIREAHERSAVNEVRNRSRRIRGKIDRHPVHVGDGKRAAGHGRVNKDNGLAIVPMGNAGTPLIKDQIPLLGCDVWEHAYYIDCRNERQKYLENFWELTNWEFVELNLERGQHLSKSAPTTVENLHSIFDAW